jgi:hypothetical protein
MRYVYRRNVFEGETTLDLTNSGLQVGWAGGTSAFVPYDKIVFVRLRYAPTRFTTNLYICTIMSLASLPVEVHSSSYAGVADFSDRAAEYRAFVEEHIKLLVIAWMAPLVWRWFRRNRPKSYEPRAVPPDVLPAAAA